MLFGWTRAVVGKRVGSGTKGGISYCDLEEESAVHCAVRTEMHEHVSSGELFEGKQPCEALGQFC